MEIAHTVEEPLPCKVSLGFPRLSNVNSLSLCYLSDISLAVTLRLSVTSLLFVELQRRYIAVGKCRLFRIHSEIFKEILLVHWPNFQGKTCPGDGGSLPPPSKSLCKIWMCTQACGKTRVLFDISFTKCNCEIYQCIPHIYNNIYAGLRVLSADISRVHKWNLCFT